MVSSKELLGLLRLLAMLSDEDKATLVTDLHDWQGSADNSLPLSFSQEKAGG